MAKLSHGTCVIWAWYGISMWHGMGCRYYKVDVSFCDQPFGFFADACLLFHITHNNGLWSFVRILGRVWLINYIERKASSRC
jgi:hypothetical protein